MVTAGKVTTQTVQVLAGLMQFVLFPAVRRNERSGMVRRELNGAIWWVAVARGGKRGHEFDSPIQGRPRATECLL
jgi:hypothetical protein